MIIRSVSAKSVIQISPLKVTLTESIGNSGNREYSFDTYHETSYCLTSSLTSTLMDTDPEDLGRISPIRA